MKDMIIKIIAKALPSLFSEKMIGTVLRHGLNLVATLLISVVGLEPGLVAEWVNITVLVGTGVVFYALSFLGSVASPK